MTDECARPLLALLQTTSVQAYKPSPAIVDYACTKVQFLFRPLGTDLGPKQAFGALVSISMVL
jgi:hypothetical protein